MLRHGLHRAASLTCRMGQQLLGVEQGLSKASTSALSSNCLPALFAQVLLYTTPRCIYIQLPTQQAPRGFATNSHDIFNVVSPCVSCSSLTVLHHILSQHRHTSNNNWDTPFEFTPENQKKVRLVQRRSIESHTSLPRWRPCSPSSPPIGSPQQQFPCSPWHKRKTMDGSASAP